MKSGYDNSSAILADGKIISWGNGGSGALGNNSTASQSVPVYLEDSEGNVLDGFIAMARGNDFAIALRNDGTVWSWGYNKYGQLGDHGTSTRYYAAEVLDATGNDNVCKLWNYRIWRISIMGI